MNKRLRTLLRAAQRIHQSYLEKRVEPVEVDLLQSDWNNYQQHTRRLAAVRRRGWKFSEREAHDCLTYAVRHLLNSLEAMQARLAEPQPTAVPPLRLIFDELCALDSEFSDVEVDLRERRITATTEPITLEGVYLGAFGIELDWKQLGYSRPYRIRALDAQPAASREDVIHPHVDGGDLCEGEGHAAIRGALAEGRLADFFIIVRQILETYNSSSAHVSLESWFSSGCDDCGGSVGEDDGCSCNNCERYVCDGCSSCCAACDDYYCGQCSSKCCDCRQWHCKDCLRDCAICGEAFCKECMSDEQCNECREDEESDDNESDDDTPDQSSADTSVEIQPEGVGQVAVPA